MARGYINVSLFRDQINQFIREDKDISLHAYNLVADKFKIIKEEMIQEFENHPITIEIDNGPDAQNTSGIIEGNGNLFSFIGFEAGLDPTDPIRDLLEETTIIYIQKAKYAGKLKIRYEFKTLLPSLKEIERITPMPSWSNGSWAIRIEKSISGISHYLFKETDESRSGHGLQIKNKVNKSLNRALYLTPIIQNFNKKVIGI